MQIIIYINYFSIKKKQGSCSDSSNLANRKCVILGIVVNCL